MSALPWISEVTMMFDLSELMHYCSINLNCCINIREYLILTRKENCETDNYGKFGKKMLL